MYCRHCGAKTIDEGLFCGSCGKEKDLGTAYCYKCGHKTRSDIMYCANCGAYNNALAPNNKRTKPTKVEEEPTTVENSTSKKESIIVIKTDKDYSMTFGKAIKSCFKKYINFSGRARRSEFWYWQLFTLIAMILFIPIMVLLEDINEDISTILLLIYMIGIIIPTCAVSSRRIHDSGNNSAVVHFIIILLSFFYGVIAEVCSSIYAEVAFVFGGIIQLISCVFALSYYCKDGDAGENKYGEDPKGRIKIEK